MCKCKMCGHTLTNPESIKRGMGKTCARIFKLQEASKPEQSEQFDMNEMRTFITSEIQRALRELNFSKTITNNTVDLGILPNKITKIPTFNPFESNKRLVIKELKEQLKTGIDNVLQKVGSFDDQIGFLDDPISILA